MDKEKVRLLVADDEEAIRGTLSALLGEEGYEVTAVSSAEEAIARLGDDSFPLVLTDIRMGGMTGIELLQEVKRLHPATEVIIMTSYASLETAVLALRSGAYDYLLKPFEDLELVTTAVARAVEKGSLVRERDALVEALARKNRELSEINAFLAERANRDGLTGLYNHRYFQEALARETALCVRHGRDLSLIFGDVDNFKKFNDTHGHQAGDAVLRGIAEILQKCIRRSDILARYGGEEFVVLLPDTNEGGYTDTGREDPRRHREPPLPRRRDPARGKADDQPGHFLLPGGRAATGRPDQGGGFRSLRGQAGRPERDPDPRVSGTVRPAILQHPTGGAIPKHLTVSLEGFTPAAPSAHGWTHPKGKENPRQEEDGNHVRNLIRGRHRCPPERFGGQEADQQGTVHSNHFYPTCVVRNRGSVMWPIWSCNSSIRSICVSSSWRMCSSISRVAKSLTSPASLMA